MKILLLEDTDRVADLIDQELQRNGLAPALWRVDSAAGLTQALHELHCDMGVSAPAGEQEEASMTQDKARQDRSALEEALASFKAAVSNMPGMVFEMEFAADGTSTLVTVSEGARDLFHTTPELLMQDPDAIGSRVVPEDMTLFLQSRKAAFLMQVDWNWTGRIHIAEMNECAAKLRVPILVLHGDKDYFNTDSDIRGFVARIAPGVSKTYRNYPDSYHLLMYDRRKEMIFRDIERWLNRLRGGRL